MIRRSSIVYWLGAALLTVGLGLAQDNDTCLMCHEDGVDAAAYGRSMHAELECVMCHQELVDVELPHDAPVAAVDCSFCHEDEAAAHGRSLHGESAAAGDPLAPDCAACHGTHDIRSHTEPDSPTAIMNIPRLCGRCHHEGSPVSITHDIPQDRILENYSLSIHGEGLFQKGLSVTAVCTSCHTAHDILPHTDPTSSINAANIATTCTQCHGQIETVHRKVIEGHLWREEPHKIPACVDCHSPHRIRRVFYPAGLANQDCLSCHGDPQLAMERDGKRLSLYVDEATYATSSHAETACAQCHTDAQPSMERACETVVSTVDCAICHAEPVRLHQASTHGMLEAEGDPDAPACLDCHGKHATQNNEWPDSPTFPRNVPQLCGRCHRAGEQAAVRIDSAVPDILASYEDSIHGRGLVDSGLLVTATCASCHGAHTELPASDPNSTIHNTHISDTCGACHYGIEEVFRDSIHGSSDVEGDRAMPTCEDCHSSHTITRTDVPGFRTVMMEQCGRCHEPEAETFFDTFHGKVSRLGGEAAAKCYDCHGTHNILPTSEVQSTLSRQNVVETCAQCHEGAHRRFAGYLTHATHHDPDRYPFLFWTFWGMTLLLVGTLSFAMLHTGAWLLRLWWSREEWRAHRAKTRQDTGKLYRRFNRFQRLLHILMLLSFFTLALTGMALKFSYATWAQNVSLVLGGFESMGLLHRLGAITLFIVFFLHLWDVRRHKILTGRSWWQTITGPDSILFNRRDLTEFIESIKWFFGTGSRPRYGRFTYWEKFDYFAVFWGIAVIGSTGMFLWFPELFTRVLPGWAINVATIIHSDEALLAVAFIFTVHFFNTHFRPDKFPMDPVIFTGRVTVEELKYDKPREYEALVRAGKLEEHLFDPFPETAERGFRIFGFIALGFGLALVGLIVYAMIFSYR